MKVEYKDKITNEIWVKDCSEVGCKNIGDCKDGCIGFLPQRELIEVISVKYDEQLGNNAELITNPPEENSLSDDPMDQAKGNFLDKHMKGY